MIHRLWRGWTKREDATRYETLLRDEIFISIKSKGVKGLQQIELLRRDLGDECEFLVVMVFDSLESVASFAGPDYEVAYIPDKARPLLARFDERATHYELQIGP